MFGKCSSLTELDISRWDTSNVTDMSRMFLSSYRLQELDVSEWDVSQVTDMSYMFQYCSSLRNLNVSNWNVSRVTNMRYMFFDASFDASQVASWDVSRVTAYDSFMNNGTLIGDIYWTFFFEGV